MKKVRLYPRIEEPTPAPKAAPLPPPEPKPPTIQEAQRWQGNAVNRVRNAEERQRRARGALAEALTNWQRLVGVTMTQEELIRQHLAAETQLRADIAAGRISPRSQGVPGPSAIDQFAFFTKQSGRRAGGGAAFRRGGVGQNELVRREAEMKARQIQMERAAIRAAQNQTT